MQELEYCLPAVDPADIKTLWQEQASQPEGPSAYGVALPKAGQGRTPGRWLGSGGISAGRQPGRASTDSNSQSRHLDRPTWRETEY